MPDRSFAPGLDYGTESATAVYEYSHGVITEALPDGGPARGRPRQRRGPRARRGVDRAVRREDLERVVLPEGPPDPGRGPDRLCRRRPPHPPRDARAERRRPHPLRLRHRLCGPRRARPRLPDGARRRVRCRGPMRNYAKIGGTEIGEEVVRIFRERGTQCPAVLMQTHGVFAVGTSVRGAVKTAVVVEDIARTVHLARTIGTPILIPPEEARRLCGVYPTRYGQRPGRGFGQCRSLRHSIPRPRPTAAPSFPLHRKIRNRKSQKGEVRHVARRCSNRT